MEFSFKHEAWSPEELDLLTLIEPLACVQHAYKRLPDTLTVASACVFGGGPLGSLHIIELSKQFPGLSIQLIDPSQERQAIAQKLFPEISVAGEAQNSKFDLVIVATSDPTANLSAILCASPMGTVIHFSGLNHKTPNELVEVEGISIESVHRNEEIRVLSTGVRLVGSSGYSRSDIYRSIESLQDDPQTYSLVQTSIVEGIDSKTITSVNGEKKMHSQPVITALLNSDREYLNDLKVVFRVHDEDDAFRVSPKKAADSYSSEVYKQSSAQSIPSGFVRLQVLRFSICNTDRRVLDGTKTANITDSFILGHEGIGTVIGVGSGVDQQMINQGISLILPHFYESNDPLLKNGVPYLSLRLKHLGIHISGCFAKYIDIPVECVLPIEPVLANGMKPIEQINVA